MAATKAVARTGHPLISAQAQLIMESMQGPIDPHNIEVREGRGGKQFKYISHGYVTKELNRVFGIFWDWVLLPAADGNRFTIVEYTQEQRVSRDEVKLVTIKEVAVVGELTIRVYAQDGVLLETVHRTGEGGKVWERNTTFADALQSASSDGLKRAAFRLGTRFGLELYYDEEEKQAEYEEKLHPKPPATIGQLLGKLQELHITPEEFAQAAGTSDLSEVKERDIPAVWEKLMEARNGTAG